MQYPSLNNHVLVRVEKSLNALSDAATSSKTSPNLLTLAIEAARARCTLGEICYALEKVWGRHRANDQVITGAYRLSTYVPIPTL